MALDDFIVGSVPTVFYIPEYVTAAEEDQLLNNTYQAPISKWKSLKNRRLQNWGGLVHDKGLLPQDLPPWLKKVTCRIYEESRLFPSAINHVLINEYLPDQGIMPHEDGPAYAPVVAILSLGSPVVMDFVPHPRLENATDNDTSGNNGEYLPFSVALMPRSLLMFKDRVYSGCLHGIKDCEHQRYDEAINFANGLDLLDSGGTGRAQKQNGGDDGVFQRTTTRVSLTCRVVPKVHKQFIKLYSTK